MEVRVSEGDNSVFSITAAKKQTISSITVEDFLTTHIKNLREIGKVGNSYAYLNLQTTLHNFCGKNLIFSLVL